MASTFTPGLVTVSFRPLSPRQIVDLARECKLTALEWGGDVHVPPGDLARAREVRQMTVDAGLQTIAYGSYFRAGEDDPATFDAIIESAEALSAPAIRIWAGRRASAVADGAYRKRVVEDVLKTADRAASAKLLVCFEFHENTLTDTDDSAAKLFAATKHPAVRTLWQPPHERSTEQCSDSLCRVLPNLQHVHVFHWPKRGEHAALADGADRWRAYLKILRQANHQCPLLLEFVRNDDPDQLRRDAATLNQWITESDSQKLFAAP